MGWPTHEWQWRNTTTEIYARKDDVANMYTGTNEDVFVHLIDKYTVDYIVVSDLEKGDYNQNGKTINTDMIKKFYDLVFTSGNGSIYRYKGLSSSGSAPAK
jgi:uncharacterized membrane protein